MNEEKRRCAAALRSSGIHFTDKKKPIGIYGSGRMRDCGEQLGRRVETCTRERGDGQVLRENETGR